MTRSARASGQRQARRRTVKARSEVTTIVPVTAMP